LLHGDDTIGMARSTKYGSHEERQGPKAWVTDFIEI